MIVKHFDHVEAMEQEAAALLSDHFGLACDEPHAVMLTGGGTPLGIYRRIEESPVAIDDQLHLLVSDERYVPLESPENNFAKMQPMIRALEIDDSRVMRVDTDLPLHTAADRYDAELASYFERGGRITLGILGLGADGHCASLFSAEDVARGAGKYAIAVSRPAGPARVSVTRDLILKTERLVYLAAGPTKAEVVRTMTDRPEDVIAGQVVQDVARTELWYAAGAKNGANY